MPLKIIWRSTVLLLTLVFIYLAFPILIVPSSLPAIKALFIEQSPPINYDSYKSAPAVKNPSPMANAEIHELNIETALTAKEKLNILKKIHQQGIDLILVRN
ncbi:MAG: hypothetical protein U9Q63_03925 [Patescibacteria group bacterium]|nr:hypothetical protein [Patescibacteria group bacterium]